MSRLALGIGTALVAIGALVFACSNGTRSSTAPQDRDDVTGSEALLLALGQVRDYNHSADVSLSMGETEKAIKDLEDALAVTFPDDDPQVTDAVRLDTRARLAKLYLGAGRLDDALKIVDDGVAQAHGDSFFLGNLLHVAGQVHEARAVHAADQGIAMAEKRAAIEAYGRSIDCEKRVQRALLKETP
jgi:hypothetical protein